jgi:RNA polymerase sigma factor (sigma-70 family)
VLSPAEIEQLYRGHARRLAGYFMRATNDAETAADLTAETFAAALAGRRRYRPERAAPTTWLYGIASHKLNDWRRRGYAEDRARRRMRMERIELTEDDVREIVRLGGEVTVMDLLEELPQDQRAAVRARLVEERGYGEIAGSEGVSEAAIRQRVSRGLASLRRRTGEER